VDWTGTDAKAFQRRPQVPASRNQNPKGEEPKKKLFGFF